MRNALSRAGRAVVNFFRRGKGNAAAPAARNAGAGGRGSSY